jgi:hypothetical protein
MASSEGLSHQFNPIRNRVYEQETSTPLPGTGKHPQGRLFNPTGAYRGDPWKLHPENWMAQGGTAPYNQVPSRGDIISWHASESSQLPRYDDPHSRQVSEDFGQSDDYSQQLSDDDFDDFNDYTDYSVDEQERPMADYGSAIGMHFGSILAAKERAGRAFVHPVRIPRETLEEPPPGSFSTDRPGGAYGGQYRSQHKIRNYETGEVSEDVRWTDRAANYAERATDLVEQGKTIAYRNDVEAAGSTSYRALPETVRTWSEDVLEAPTGSFDVGRPHPGLTHLAKQGYNPVALTSDRPLSAFGREQETWRSPVPAFEQLSLFQEPPTQSWLQPPESEFPSKSTLPSRVEAFDSGRSWHLRKPDEEHSW